MKAPAITLCQTGTKKIILCPAENLRGKEKELTDYMFQLMKKPETKSQVANFQKLILILTQSKQNNLLVFDSIS